MVTGNGREDTAKPSTHGRADALPSYEAISTKRSDHGPTTTCSCSKSPRRSSGTTTRQVCDTTPPPNLSPRTSNSSPSARMSNQVRATVSTLVRDLVLNPSADAPSILASCANACRTYDLDFAGILQEPYVERRSTLYWAIVQGRDALVPALLAHAAPLSRTTAFEVRVACLVAGNQRLFQSLRHRRSDVTPLSTDALLLGSTPADEVLVSEAQGTFAVEMRINLWQKRLRVSGTVSVEFIARSRLWCITFYSPPSSLVLGPWQVALQLQRPSPPTFVDAVLIVQPPSTPDTNASQASDLISLSPPPDESPTSPESETPQTVRLCLSSTRLLSCRESTHVEQWVDDDDDTCTNAIVVPLDDGAGAELLYDNTPFVAPDGTLHARLEARLEKPSTTAPSENASSDWDSDSRRRHKIVV